MAEETIQYAGGPHDGQCDEALPAMANMEVATVGAGPWQGKPGAYHRTDRFLHGLRIYEWREITEGEGLAELT